MRIRLQIFPFAIQIVTDSVLVLQIASVACSLIEFLPVKYGELLACLRCLPELAGYFHSHVHISVHRQTGFLFSRQMDNARRLTCRRL